MSAFLHKQSSILIIDDDVNSIRLLSQILKDFGRILFATDGEMGLLVAKDQQPDLILLDVEMRPMDGYEVCRKLKSNPKTQDVPVILCSSKSEDFDKHWGMRQGADAYVCKPFDPVELISTIKQLLRN